MCSIIKINSLYGVQTSSNRSRLWFSEILKTFLLWTAWFDWSLWYQFSVKSKHSRKWTQKKLGHFVSSWLPFHFSEMKGYGGAGKAKAATPAASGLFPSLTFLVTSAWHRSPLILSFSSFVSNDIFLLFCVCYTVDAADWIPFKVTKSGLHCMVCILFLGFFRKEIMNGANILLKDF